MAVNVLKSRPSHSFDKDTEIFQYLLGSGQVLFMCVSLQFYRFPPAVRIFVVRFSRLTI